MRFWFRASVIDIRMLRIEENNDLMPAVGAIFSFPLDRQSILQDPSDG